MHNMTWLTLLHNSCGRHFCQWAIQQQTNRGRTHYSSRHSLFGWAVAVSDGAPLKGTLGHVHLMMLLIPSHFHSQLSSHAKPPHSPNRMCDRTCAKMVCLAPLFDQNSNFIYAVHMSHRFLQNPCASQFDRLDFWILLVYLQEFAYHASGPTKLWEKCTKICGKRVNARKTCAKIRAWIVRPSADWTQPGPSTHQLA